MAVQLYLGQVVPHVLVEGDGIIFLLVALFIFVQGRRIRVPQR